MMKSTVLHPLLSGYERLVYPAGVIWRGSEDVAGRMVAFDIRAQSLTDEQATQVLEFFERVKRGEPECRRIIAEDVVRDDGWSTFVSVGTPSLSDLYESMTLKDVVFDDPPSLTWKFILSYESLLFESFGVDGWFDHEGKFLHAEIE